jgi:hypothetical protein
VGGGGDDQVHGAGSALSADLGDSGGELCVAVGDGVVNRQRIEPALDRAEPTEPGGAGVF